MNNMPSVSTAAPNLPPQLLSFLARSLSLKANNMNQQEKQYMQLLSAQVISIAKSLDSNPAVKGILFPVTNFPECILQGHDLALTIESIAKEEFNKATSKLVSFASKAADV
ncbi:hypothetical protein GGF37_005302, partial [Kickxella alabastrina]